MIRRERRSDLLGRGDVAVSTNICYCDSCKKEISHFYDPWKQDNNFCFDCAIKMAESEMKPKGIGLCERCGWEEDLYEYYDGSLYCMDCCKELAIEEHFRKKEVA